MSSFQNDSELHLLDLHPGEGIPSVLVARLLPALDKGPVPSQPISHLPPKYARAMPVQHVHDGILLGHDPPEHGLALLPRLLEVAPAHVDRVGVEAHPAAVASLFASSPPRCIIEAVAAIDPRPSHGPLVARHGPPRLLGQDLAVRAEHLILTTGRCSSPSPRRPRRSGGHRQFALLESQRHLPRGDLDLVPQLDDLDLFPPHRTLLAYHECIPHLEGWLLSHLGERDEVGVLGVALRGRLPRPPQYAGDVLGLGQRVPLDEADVVPRSSYHLSGRVRLEPIEYILQYTFLLLQFRREFLGLLPPRDQLFLLQLSPLSPHLHLHQIHLPPFLHQFLRLLVDECLLILHISEELAHPPRFRIEQFVRPL
mmetsp:Transcript_31021/g.93026  ORF Transcript_31021/g.93026 Transcript_31021/m.93026 type:complete len:368 (+) Transcript_31021:275-1378(+)